MSRCGLLTAQKEPVPLKSVEVELEVKDHVATVVSTLNYENKEDKPIEAVFVFPLPGDAAVCHFSAKIGQRQIVAEVKEKQEAREQYDDALSSGQQAFLLEESDQSPDIFSLSVGSLPPGESASIRLEYVTELAVQADDGLRFCLPAVLNPRYQPQGSEGAGVQVTSVPASLVPYSLSFSARVSSPRPVSKVESSSSLDPLQYLNTEQTQATVKLAAGHKFDRDVELLIYYKDAHQPTAVVEAGQASAKPGTLMGDPVVMLSLYPEFPQAVMSSIASCGEFVFLLDRSGSMACCTNNSKPQETRIGSARDTLLLLLKSLPMGCYFNIYSFGSSYEHIFPKSVEYSQTSMEEALKKVEEMQANLGGTEILRPLDHIYSQPCVPGHPRQLFVFTDGEVGNTKQVIDLVKKNSGSHRCFSFGIGEGASSALINGLAKEGGGRAQFITGADRMQPKVMQSLRFSLQPAVQDVSVTWDLPKGVSATVLSPPLTSIFQGQRSLIYAQLTGQSSEAADGCVTVNYSLAGRLRFSLTPKEDTGSLWCCFWSPVRLAGRPSQSQLRFSLTPKEDTGLTVHRLGARTLIRSLEMQEREHREQRDGKVKKKVVELSVQSGVSSSYTAFIAVNKDDGKTIQGPLVRRNVPAPILNSGFLRSTVQQLRCSMLMTMSYDDAETDYNDQEPYGCCLLSDDERTGGSYLGVMTVDDDAETDYNDQEPYGCCLLYDDERTGGSYLRAMTVDDDAETDSDDLETYDYYDHETYENDLGAMTDDADTGPKQPHRDPLLQLVSLQEASGCWPLNPALAAALGKTSKEVENTKPASVNKEVWATVLALIWLHGFKMDAKEEWELLAMKAVSWLKAQNAPCVTDCVEAGNALLRCELQKIALGL